MIDRNDVNKNRIYWKRKQKLNNESKNYHLCWDSNLRPQYRSSHSYHCAREAVILFDSQVYYKPIFCPLRSTTIHNSENGQFLRLNKQLCDVDLALRLSSINGKCLCKMRYYISAKSATTR